ncbi:MAG TPA: hypothetical protein PKY77_13020 [Phycisphaerae bacterium]|nr:hypothetical protein [Phycisphaerae bacterium]HRY68273.1 hypothetical protein [Phycisphaerae bacterium]HSA26844.1 hypothetical protein [Phycisphaerae bacterium]
MEDDRAANKGVDVQVRAAFRQDRRRFLQQVSAGAMAIVGSQAMHGAACKAEQAPASPSVGPGGLPTIRIGKHRLTRLIVGSNPVEGYSHSSSKLDLHMGEYFTLEKTVEFISSCEQLGINTWQSGHGPSQKVLDALKILRERGSKIQWCCLATETRPGDSQKSVKELLSYKPIAIIHHGGATDSLFREGKAEQVHDYVKKVHDAGVTAGVSAHNPANIAYMEEHGWENEFFMTCLYQVSRPGEEIRRKLGTGILDEPFLESDRDEMTAVIRKVKRPCLAFKILAAGRLCRQPADVESAFKYAFANIKKTDGVIVGMYPRFADEARFDVEMTLRHGGLA